MDSDNEIVERGKESEEDANILKDISVAAELQPPMVGERKEPESDFVQRIDGELVDKEVRFFWFLYCEALDFFFGIVTNESWSSVERIVLSNATFLMSRSLSYWLNTLYFMMIMWNLLSSVLYLMMHFDFILLICVSIIVFSIALCSHNLKRYRLRFASLECLARHYWDITDSSYEHFPRVILFYFFLLNGAWSGL